MRFSEGGIGSASKRHDRKANLGKTLDIYREIGIN